MFTLGLWQFCGSGERCGLRVIHPNLISLLSLAPLGASAPDSVSPRGRAPGLFFSSSHSVPRWSGTFGKSHPSSAAAAHLPPTLLPAPASATLIPAPRGHPPPGCLDIPPHPSCGASLGISGPPGNNRGRGTQMGPLRWVSRCVPGGLCVQTSPPPTHALGMMGAKP